MLDERKAAVLKALVEVHIQTGEPVSSRAILDASGLSVSSATVRNDLVVLERDGYAVQPHTSAGRVPTAQAYRYYVDHLSPVRLRSAIRAKIESFFTTIHDELGRMLQSTSDLVAEITHLPALVLGPTTAGEPIRGIHVVQLSERAVLAVIVTNSGRVVKEVAQLAEPVAVEDVEAAEALVAETCCGGSIAAAADRIESASEAPPQVRRLAKTVIDAVTQSVGHPSDLYLGGTSRLAALWQDLAKVQRILDLLEQEASIQKLLEEADEGTLVRIGSELPLEDADLALIATSYAAGAGAAGRLGVLGPMRMDYRRTIGVVEEVGEGLGESLGN